MGRITTKGGRKMTICKTYDEAKLIAINLLSNPLNCVTHLHIMQEEGTYYVDYEEDYMIEFTEEESEAE